MPRSRCSSAACGRTAEPDQRTGRLRRWDAIRHWEPKLRAAAPDETGQPEVTLALATDIAVVDHVSGSVWLIANAVNVDDRPTRADAAYDEAIERLDAMQRKAPRRWRGRPV